MAITPSKRATVGHRDEWRCHYCRIELTDETMTLDHVYPHRKGGSNANWNLVASCKPCNNGFGDKLEKCNCSFCLAAYRRTTAARDAAHRPRPGTTLADAAGYRWTPDGWQPYAASEHLR